VDPDLEQISAAHKIGADWVEIHTGKYCEMKKTAALHTEKENLINACKLARKVGLRVAAGHGLNYVNINGILDIKEIEEFNIGHSIIAKSVFVGLERAVKEMADILKCKCIPK